MSWLCYDREHLFVASVSSGIICHRSQVDNERTKKNTNCISCTLQVRRRNSERKNELPSRLSRTPRPGLKTECADSDFSSSQKREPGCSNQSGDQRRDKSTAKKVPVTCWQKEIDNAPPPKAGYGYWKLASFSQTH